uniref:Uncharacterized protein n=1 Tax=Helianthus annuus TaxID=4232 RepID=A0A251TXS3_HELAN
MLVEPYTHTSRPTLLLSLLLISPQPQFESLESPENSGLRRRYVGLESSLFDQNLKFLGNEATCFLHCSRCLGYFCLTIQYLLH